MKKTTVLDRLVEEHVIDRDTAKALRKSKIPSTNLALKLRACLMQLDRQDSRLAARRNFVIAIEHAYYVSIGERAPIQKIADVRGYSVSTVSNAVRTSRDVEIMTPGERAPWLMDSIDAAYADLRKPRVGNKVG